MQEVLPVQFMHEDEDIVDTHSKHKEGDYLSNDEGALDTNEGEQADGGRYGKNDESNTEQTKGELRTDEESSRKAREDGRGETRVQRKRG